MKRLSVVAVCFLLCWTASAPAQFSAAEHKPSISVSGTAEIRVVPDEVNLRIGVETRDAKLDEAVKQNETRLAAVLKFLKESNIDAKDIQTDYVQIEPVYNSDRRAQQVTPEYYLVHRNLGIRLRKVAQFDAVLAGALRSGANHVDGVEFRTTELRKHRDTAREQAIRAAKEKAVALAQQLDAKIGKPQSINEQTTGGWMGYPINRWSNANFMAQNVSQPTAAGEGSEGNLAIGMINVSATVNVTFALE
jgi:uncharacterized protein YggE